MALIAPAQPDLAASAALLSNPGLGADVSAQLKDELADRRKKILAIGQGNPAAYGQIDPNAGPGLGPVASLFGAMK